MSDPVILSLIEAKYNFCIQDTFDPGISSDNCLQIGQKVNVLSLSDRAICTSNGYGCFSIHSQKRIHRNTIQELLPVLVACDEVAAWYSEHVGT